MKRILIAIPMHVACESPIFTPSRYRALIVYAETSEFNERILYIWKVVVKVVLPYCINFMELFSEANL